MNYNYIVKSHIVKSVQSRSMKIHYSISQFSKVQNKQKNIQSQWIEGTIFFVLICLELPQFASPHRVYGCKFAKKGIRGGGTVRMNNQEATRKASLGKARVFRCDGSLHTWVCARTKRPLGNLSFLSIS